MSPPAKSLTMGSRLLRKWTWVSQGRLVLQREESSHHQRPRSFSSTASSLDSPWSYVHNPVSRPLKYQTVASLLDDAAEDNGGADEAVVDVQRGIRKTFAEVRQEAEALACGFLSLEGVSPGDRIALFAPNLYEWYLTQLAAAKAGLVLVCVNPGYQPRELEHALRLTGVRLLVAADRAGRAQLQQGEKGLLDVLEAVVPQAGERPGETVEDRQLPNLRHIVVIAEEENARGHTRLFDIAPPSLCPTKKHRHLLKEIQEGMQADDPNNIQFTSGTTGNPKAATLSHFNVINNSYSMAKRMGFMAKPHRICLGVPFFHCFGNVAGTLVGLHARAACVLPSPSYSPVENLRAVEAERCTALYGTPTMWSDMLSARDSVRADLSSLETGFLGAAPYTPELCKRITKELNVRKLITGYGMTETSPLSLMCGPRDPAEVKFKAVGAPLPDLEIKVVDKKGKIVRKGETGELLVRGYSVMLGYWGENDKTAETLGNDGWLRTGDLAKMRSDGYFEIVGRKKDVIIRGGENIFPKEIESVLIEHPSVEDVHICGVPDERLGEIVCAWIKLAKDDSHLDGRGVKNFLRGKIADYKIPSHVILTDDFPRTASGKVQKFRMTEESVRILAERKNSRDHSRRTTVRN